MTRRVIVVGGPPGPAGHQAHRGDVLIAGAGHWVQQESADEVSAALVGFLDDVCRERS